MAPGGRTHLGKIALLKKDLGYDEEIKDLKDMIISLNGRVMNLEMEIDALEKVFSKNFQKLLDKEN